MYIIINVDIPVRVINHCSQAYSKQGKNLLLVENRWPRTGEGGGGLYFVYQCDFYYRRERRIYSVFARLNSWMKLNGIEEKRRYICLRPCVRLARINFLARQCLVSYRFLSISVLGWDDESCEMRWWSFSLEECIEGVDDFFGDIMHVLRGEDNCFIVNVVEEWYKWWNFVTICVFCECGIEQR